MAFELRDYQQNAVDAAITWIKKSLESGIIEAATGAGKSLIVANIAHHIKEASGMQVLCLHPSKELVEQNYEKYTSYGYDASIYSGAIKSMRHPVIFGTYQTIKNCPEKFKNCAAVIIDECHEITPSIIKIIDTLKTHNKKLRVLGLTATPYRLGTGYIYRYDDAGNPVPEDQVENPYFNRLIFRITAHELIARGYLTQPHCDPELVESYDTSGIKHFTTAEIERAFEGHGRKTASIIADVVAHAKYRLGVMVFAATRQHASECMASLPPELSRMINGDTPKAEREKIISDFKEMRFKYLVSVGTLTKGFDAPHVDLIAIMRKTESPALLQQIIGRGMRLHPLKKDCQILDYAENIKYHQLEDDLFTPIIKARKGNPGENMPVQCPLCNTVNQFTMRPNPDKLGIDLDGFFTDLTGERIKSDNDQFLPAHFGRRCFGMSLYHGVGHRCEHRWSVKKCLDCEHENDIAARFCESCKSELVDPNDKLREQFTRIKKDPYSVSTDRVLEFSVKPHLSKAGNETLLATYKTEYRTVTKYYIPASASKRIYAQYEEFSKAYYAGHVAPDVQTFIQYLDKGVPPSTITYQRIAGTNNYEIYAYNKAEDEIPSMA